MQLSTILSNAVGCALVLASCADPGPTFGAPSGILGRRLPDEQEAVFDRPDSDAGPGPGSGPATTLASAHAAGGGPAPSDELDCLAAGCHRAGGRAPPFAFGGRVGGGDAGVAGAKVLVLEGDRRLGPATSDRDGFFWLPGEPAKAGGKAYLKSGAAERAMSSPLPESGGGCDSAQCHVPGKVGKIHP
jgi:hypothetical protein